MEVLSTEVFTAVLALVGIVIMIAALFSGLIERSNLPQVAIFLALGAALGPAGLGVVNIGLDSPALRVVATGIQEVRADRPEMAVVLITHYQRLLDEIRPDHVHVLVDGRIVASGAMELVAQLERDGYDAFRSAA